MNANSVVSWVWTHPGSLGHHQERSSKAFWDAWLGSDPAHGPSERAFGGLFDQPMADWKVGLGPRHHLGMRASGTGRLGHPDRANSEASL